MLEETNIETCQDCGELLSKNEHKYCKDCELDNKFLKNNKNHSKKEKCKAIKWKNKYE